LIIATAGHIDHGKTLLVKALTGVDTDRLPEEKRRGLTIDLGFAYKPLGDGAVSGFVDVPGHERFVRNMLAGVANIDYALLVVAADDGPMPQTVEHLAILDLLGVTSGVIALTKTDRADAARIADVTNAVRSLLQGTGLASAQVIPVSAVTGAGVDTLRGHLAQAAIEVQARTARGNFRLAVDRSFTVAGAGLVVTGSVFSGTARTGDTLVLSPAGTEVRARQIHAQNQESELGSAGQRCAVNLAGRDLRKAEVRRGDWLVAEPAHAPAARLDARVRVLASEARPLRHWTPVHVHIGAADVPGRVAVLEGRAIAPGESALAQIVFDRQVGALKGDRFILRDQSATRTMAGGAVIDPFPPARGRAKPERIEFLAAMELAAPGEALSALLDLAPFGLNLSRFATAHNLTDGEAAELWAAANDMVAAGPEAAPLGFSDGNWKALGEAVTAALKSWHAEKPEHPGPSPDQLRAAMRPRPPLAALNAVLEDLISSARVSRANQALRLAGFETSMAPADQATWDKIKPLLIEGGLRPPIVHDIAGVLAMDPKQVDRFLGRMARQGLVTQVASNRYFPPQAVIGLARIAQGLAEADADGLINVRAFRDASDIGRNLVIEVLEYFDRLGFTHRRDDGRIIVKPLDKIFPGTET